jgi:hypothetical protein
VTHSLLLPSLNAASSSFPLSLPGAASSSSDLWPWPPPPPQTCGLDLLLLLLRLAASASPMGASPPCATVEEQCGLGLPTGILPTTRILAVPHHVLVCRQWQGRWRCCRCFDMRHGNGSSVENRGTLINPHCTVHDAKWGMGTLPLEIALPLAQAFAKRPSHKHVIIHIFFVS